MVLVELDRITWCKNTKNRRNGQRFSPNNLAVSSFFSCEGTYAEKKKTLKGYYPQERWMDYGVPGKR